jgi:hypothetical protein
VGRAKCVTKRTQRTLTLVLQKGGQQQLQLVQPILGECHCLVGFSIVGWSGPLAQGRKGLRCCIGDSVLDCVEGVSYCFLSMLPCLRDFALRCPEAHFSQVTEVCMWVHKQEGPGRDSRTVPTRAGADHRTARCLGVALPGEFGCGAAPPVKGSAAGQTARMIVPHACWMAITPRASGWLFIMYNNSCHHQRMCVQPAA